ncbi:MAG: hypothetical protein IIZ35_06920 [Clostridia bacterium]|nr:hypothetical protein [Clostridia bacterium]
MKRLLYVLKAVGSIGSAVLIYMTVTKARAGDENLILYITACVFAVAVTAAFFCLGALCSRTEKLEEAVRRLTYDSFGEEIQDEGSKRECPVCHTFYGGESCPYCGAVGEKASDAADVFATEDPDYKGTDFSSEDYVSAHAPEDVMDEGR